jgi:hypothetical protein
VVRKGSGEKINRKGVKIPPSLVFFKFSNILGWGSWRAPHTSFFVPSPAEFCILEEGSLWFELGFFLPFFGR